MGSVDEILISASPGETRLALIAGAVPVEFIVDRGDGLPGDVVLGRVLSVNHPLGAAFVDIGAAQPGFLSPVGKARQGDALLVQVTASARAAKGAELTAAPSLAGQVLAYSPFRPGLSISRKIEDEAERARLRALVKPWLMEGEGVVLRTGAAGRDEADLLAELNALRGRWQAIADARAVAEGAKAIPARLHAPTALERLLTLYPGVRAVWVDDHAALAEARKLFASAQYDAQAFARHDAADLLEDALSPVAPLPGGGTLIFGTAAGMTVIDIDSGAGSPMEANMDAVPEIARQMRLRALAGHILVDLIPSRDRRALGRLVQAMRDAVADDPTPTHVVGTTPLGLLEMTRERHRPTLAETFLEPTLPTRSADSLALAALRALLAEAQSRPAARLGLALSPTVMSALMRRPTALAIAAARLGQAPTLREDAGSETLAAGFAVIPL